jgi:hypothetical protein
MLLLIGSQILGNDEVSFRIGLNKVNSNIIGLLDQNEPLLGINIKDRLLKQNTTR